MQNNYQQTEVVNNAPQDESTPKTASYQCLYTFMEQVEIFRMLHPGKDVEDDTIPLNKADRTFRVQCMKAMGLDPCSQQVFFGGEFKVALEMACLSDRCYRTMKYVFSRWGEIPNLINSSTFREVCEFRDEDHLFTLLNDFAFGRMSKKEFNNAVADAKSKSQDMLGKEQLKQQYKEIKEINEGLLRKVEKLEAENKRLKEKLAQQKDSDVFTFDSESPKSNYNEVSESSSSSEIDSSASICSYSPAYEPSLRLEDSDSDDVFNKNIPDQRLGIASTTIKKCEGLKKRFKRKKVDVSPPTIHQGRAKRVSEIFRVGDTVQALWRDKNPNLTNYHDAVIENTVSSDMYKIRFVEDGCRRFVNKKDLKKL